MTTNEIFKELLKDPILIEKYGFSIQQLEMLRMHEPSKQVIELIKLILLGKENNIPDSSIYNQVKKLQKI